jgi:uncharacterized protein YqgV (UPF0045/DUF77 family)
MAASAQPWRRQPRYERLVSGERIKVEDSERTCAHPDCETKLSRYNPDGTCSRHGGWTDESVPHRGRKPAKRVKAGDQPPAGTAEGAPTANGVTPATPTAVANGAAAAHIVTIRAEIVIDASGATADRETLGTDVLEALQGLRVDVERGRLSTLVTGEVHDVLHALETAHLAVALKAGRLVTTVRLETCA